MVGNNIKRKFAELIANGKFVPLRASNPSVFAYSMSYDGKSIIVIGNLNFRANVETTVSVPRLQPSNIVIPIKIDSIPINERSGIKTSLKSGEIQVLLVDDLEIK